MSKKVKVISMISAAMLIVALTVAMVVILVNNSRHDKALPVYRSATLEAGEQLDASIFLKSNQLTAVIDANSVYDTSKVGDYTLILHLSDGSDVEVTLRVRDTVPPTVKQMPPLLVKKDSALLPEDLLPEDCIADATSVKVTLLSTAANTSSEGANSISLRLEDEGGNTVKVDARYYVTEALNGAYIYEIGSPAPDEEILLPGCGARFREGQKLTASEPGKVTVYVTVFGEEYILRYSAADTIAPKATAKSGMRFPVGENLPEDPYVFLASLEDATQVTVRYAEDYVLDKAEQRIILLILTDLGGNNTTLEVTVFVYEEDVGADTVPPVISGVKDLTTELGVEPDYLAGISVYDGRDGIIPKERVTVDTSAVRLNEISGDEGYPIVYTVYDEAGNKAEAKARVRVVRPQVSDEDLEECFGEVMQGIAHEGLSRFTVLSNVYDYVTVRYALSAGTANSDGSDYRVEAYWGFKLKRGNYETYCAMTQVILDELEIDYIRVNRQKTGSVAHGWLMVDYGIGWLYMDCTPIDGYVWTKDGRIVRIGSEEEKTLSKTDIMARKAMTDADLKQFTELSNGAIPGWNYYKIDVSEGILPPAAVRTAEGGYLPTEYTVSYEALSGGVVSGSKQQTVVHGRYTAAVTAMPKPGYRFVAWDDGVTEATRTDCIKRNFTVKAIFELDNGTISYYDVFYRAGEHGSIKGQSEQLDILYGRMTTQVTAVPDVGYYFLRWSDGNTYPTRSDVVRGDAAYTAIFEKMVTLTYVAGTGGRIEGNDRQLVIPGTSGDYVRAIPDPGYIFKQWSDGVPTAERRDTDSSDLTLIAYFEKDTSVYQIQYVAGAGGTIRGDSIQRLVCGAEGSEVEAVANAGYVFVSWDDGSTDPKRTDRIYADRTLTAVFRPLEQYTLSYEAQTGGTIDGDAAQTVIEGQSGSPVTAKADEGYHFVSWNDGKTDATRTDFPTGDVTYTAIFEKDEVPEPPVDPLA